MTDYNINNCEEELQNIKNLREQKFYPDACILAIELYEKHVNNLNISQIRLLYNELLNNNQEGINKYADKFLNILNVLRNIDQTQNLKLLNNQNPNEKINELFDINLESYINDIKFYRLNNYTLIAYEMAKYIYQNYLSKLTSGNKLIIFDELIINGYYINKKESYNYAIEWYNQLSISNDCHQLDILCKNFRYIDNIKFYDDHENIYNKMLNMINEYNFKITKKTIENDSGIKNRAIAINNRIKKDKTIYVKYINGGHYFEDYFYNLLKVLYEDYQIKNTTTNDYQFLVCSLFGNDIIKVKTDQISVHFNGEPKESYNINKYDVIMDTKINNYSLHVPHYVTSFYQRKCNTIIDLLKKITPEKNKFCAHMSYVCYKHREEFYNKLSQYKKVDALGLCMKNRVNDKCMPADHDRLISDDKKTFYDTAVIKYLPYKFVMAFENTSVLGYITEKIINPILAGAIPIYWGTSDVKKHFNPKRFIYVNDFSSIDECIKYIAKIDNDDELYQQIINEPFMINNELNEYCLEHNDNTYVKYMRSLLQIDKNNLLDERTNAYVINLDRRYDRWELLNNKFSDIKSIKLIKFSALQGNPGWHYCGFSHQQILKDHQNDNSNILILEDDCLIKNTNMFDIRWPKIKKWLDNNEDEWDIFSGGATGITGPIKIINRELQLANIYTAYTTHFIYYNKKYIDQILKWHPDTNLRFDQFRNIDYNIKILISVPYLAIQSITYSNIENNICDYHSIFNNAEQQIIKEINCPGSSNITYNDLIDNIINCAKQNNMQHNIFLLIQDVCDYYYDYLTIAQKIILINQLIIVGYYIDKEKTNHYIKKWLVKLNNDENLKIHVKQSNNLLDNLRFFNVII